jgi:hypothetical protein
VGKPIHKGRGIRMESCTLHCVSYGKFYIFDNSVIVLGDNSSANTIWDFSINICDDLFVIVYRYDIDGISYSDNSICNTIRDFYLMAVNICSSANIHSDG